MLCFCAAIRRVPMHAEVVRVTECGKCAFVICVEVNESKCFINVAVIIMYMI